MVPDGFFAHPLYPRLTLVAGVALGLESVWLLIRGGLAVPWGEMAANLFSFFVGEGFRLAMRGAFLTVYFAAASLAPWQWGWSPPVVVLCFLGVDLLLYLWHRALHAHPLGWALHSVHHSGRAFSLSLGGRLPWPLRCVDDLVCVPLALVGFDPGLIYLCMAVSVLAQYLAHAGLVGRLGPLDAVLNTPSNHRVHHHEDGPGQLRNFGAALIVWDRLFGTYLREPEGEAAFGLRGVPSSVNPFVIQVQGLVRLVRGKAAP